MTMETPRQITVLQATIIIASTNIGVGALIIPRLAVQHVDSGAPLLTLLGFILAMIGIVSIAALGKRFPNHSIIQYTETITGKWPARLCNVFVILFFMILTAFTAREFDEVIITSVLRNTPIEISILVMIVIAAVASRNDIATFSYIHQFYFPFIIIPALVIITLSLKEGSEEVKLMIWPVLDLARMTSFPSQLLERLDVLFLALWLTAVFTSLYSPFT